MITLPNGCSCSNLSVSPKNWQSKNARVNKDWYIMYRFYDPRYPKPKQVMVKGMNQYKKLSERQEATKTCLTEELDKLVNGSCNPFVRVAKTVESITLMTKETPIAEANGCFRIGLRSH